MQKVWRLIVKFFNTTIKKYGLDGKEIIDDSPKVSMLTGVVMILVGGVLVTFLVIFYFAFVA